MNSLFEESAKNEILRRISALSPQSRALWGKMNVAQMLAHCTGGLYLAMGKLKPKREPIGLLFGWLFKSSYYNNRKFPRNIKTIKGGSFNGDHDFEKEKINLITTLEEFYLGGVNACTKHPHPIMGTFTPEQWGVGMYKHLDHHLRQFGV